LRQILVCGDGFLPQPSTDPSIIGVATYHLVPRHSDVDRLSVSWI
jgi:hypothetical protein